MAMYHIRGTVILRIWHQILFVATYTTSLCLVHNYVDGIEIDFPMTLIPVLGVVTGLLLVFRTNTAYDRYWEGRKFWSTMTLNIRTLTRCFWVVVEEKHKSARDVIEKASAINLLVAFAYATKNYLREEYSYDQDDLRELIGHLPRFSTPSSNQPLNFQEQKDGRMAAPTKLRKATFGEIHYRKGAKSHAPYDAPVPTNIPIELSYYIASYINDVRERQLVDPSTVMLMNNALTSLLDCLGGFERILRTPIPLAYSVHLRHATWLYLLALPYQLIGTLNWWTVPAVTLAAFALLGILGIGWEIENPFGYDDNDLPLDDFCKVIHREILRIIRHPMPKPESWILSAENHPLAPESYLNAVDLLKINVDDIRSILKSHCLVELCPSRHEILTLSANIANNEKDFPNL